MKKVIYQLNVEDLQTVANQELDRDLTIGEIKEIEKLVAEKISWYDIIADSIDEYFAAKQV
jgi:hypothetical protein